MSEPKLISPMLDNFAMGDPISNHHGVRCCPAMEEGTNQRFIVKLISIPASQTQLDALLLSGAYADETAANEYFKELAGGVIAEVEVLEKLSKLEGFLGFDKWQLVPMDGQTGFDIYLLSTYKRTLQRYLKKQSMTHLGALNLGLDLCASLSVCRRSGYLYVDLKPSNIYVTDDNAYRIGDLGFLRLDSLKYASLPDKYRSQYTAPEITDAFSALNTTLDVYAVGLILYQTYNDGVLPFSGDTAPAEAFPAPAYADYELSEIILKACAPDPADRWENPMQLGQAIVSYIQRNGAHDMPIVPPPSSVAEDVEEEQADGADKSSDAAEAADVPAEVDEAEDVPEVSIPYEDISEQNNEDYENLSFLLDADDETDPAFENEQINYAEVTEETSEILSQADEIANHPVPDPVVAPEPVEIPLPEPIVIEEPESTNEENEDFKPVKDETSNADEEDQEFVAPPKKKSHWLRTMLIVLLVLAAVAAGIYYYTNYYLLHVESIHLDGDKDTLTVEVSSAIDESLLTVICSDPHGNQIPAPVINGTATFADLMPDTAYTVKIAVNGFHRLTGDTAKAYSTPVQSNIVQFNAVTGAEDGSVILGFTVDGPDSDEWTVVYTADGEDEKTAVLPSHMGTVTGLTVGKVYTFRLVPKADLYVTGNDQITFTASKLVYAQNLRVTSCVDGKLTAVWDAPEDAMVDSWSVRCYNNDGFNETLTVSECNVAFDVPNDAAPYSLEVSAAGMSVNQRVDVPKDSVTLSDFQLDLTKTKASISWSASTDTEENQWLVSYTVNGVAISEAIACTGNSVAIHKIVPSAEYKVSVKLPDNTDALGGVFTFTTEAAEAFSSNYSDRALTPDNFTFRMCRTPAWEDWDRHDIDEEDFTTEFSVNEKASFLLHVDKSYGYSDDEIQALFVVTDTDGKLVCVSSKTEIWDDMWYVYYCELDIPVLPSEPGQYNMQIYFNGMLAGTQTFYITN